MIRILTDSAADILPKEAAEKDLEVVPLTISFPEAEYDPSQDEDFSQFYSLLQSEKKFPTTSQPAPEAFIAPFEAAKKAGDPLVAILISSGLSGTLQSARVAKDAVGYDGIHLIDSRCAIMAQRILVEYATKLRSARETVDSLVKKVESVRDRVRVFGMLDTLTYLYKGGRLSRTVALAGNLLHIKPVITAKDGVIAVVGRGRNDQALIDRFESMGYDPEFPVYFGYTANDANAQRLMSHTLAQFPKIGRTGLFPIGGLIGAHVGPDGMAIAFVPREA